MQNFVFFLRTFSGFRNNIACIFIQFLLYWERIQDIDVDSASDAVFHCWVFETQSGAFLLFFGYILRVQIFNTEVPEYEYWYSEMV